jgi:hypothetical protein
VKNLDDIPMPEPHGERDATYSRIRFSDSRQAADSPGLYQCFSEVTTMADDTTDMSEDEKDEADYNGDHSTKSPEEVEKMREKARSGLKKWAERCRKMGETDEALHTYLAGTPMPEKKADVTPEGSAKFAEQFKPMIDAAVAEAVKQVESRFAPIQKQVHDFEANTKRASVQKFCETMVQAGKIIPAQLEQVQSRLLRADAHAKVHKFGEGGKECVRTELDEQMAEIQNGPVLLKFGERKFGNGGNASADDGKAAVEAHYEAFAETYERMGTTKEEIVSAYEGARKMNPKLTAEKFLAAKAV